MRAWLPRLLLALALAGAGPAAFSMSKAKEAEVGKQMYDEILAKSRLYHNPGVVDYVTRIGQTIAKLSDWPDLEYTFTVIDSDDINAFATPGGYVYVYRGLLPYLDSEAELAAVLSHEIAHVTERHSSRQENMATAGNVASAILGLLAAIGTGSNAVGGVTQDAVQMGGAAMVRGYGRDMELEADRVGARYMHKAGYDPQEMLQVLGALKDQERFSVKRARKEGRSPMVYHGVFSSHPRNDDRLKEVVAAAGELDDGQFRDARAEEFRRMTEGLKFSEESRAAVVIDNRYYNGKMGITVAFPTDWRVVSRASGVLSAPNRDQTLLQMGVKRSMDEMTPEEFAANMLGMKDLRETETLELDENIKGFMALRDQADGSLARRVAVLYFPPYAYTFEGRTANTALAGFYDSMFQSTIRSFRAMTDQDRDSVLGIHIHYVQAPEGITFAKLAEISPLKEYPEEMLRLVNGYYPTGEPEPGEWIKIFR